MLNLHFTYFISRYFHSLRCYHSISACLSLSLPFLVVVFLFAEFKRSARRRRCTLLFAWLLINSFKKQIFACIRSAEAIYIISVYANSRAVAVGVCVFVFWKRILHQFIICRLFSAQFYITHPSWGGSLNVTINSDEFVDMCQPVHGVFICSFTHTSSFVICAILWLCRMRCRK